MRKTMKKRVLGIALVTAMIASSLTGCGKNSNGGNNGNNGNSNKSAETSSESGGKYEKTITVDVFDSQANFQGVQSGWFAKIVKEKFNMELNIIAPNVAGGGDSLYQTRSANGDLGDLIITNLDKSRLKDMVSAGLVLNMTDYLDSCENLKKYEEAIKQASELAETEGMWAVPSEISNQAATEPCEALEPTNAPSLRWDLYAAVGYPQMSTLEDMLDVLKQMQDKAGKSDSGKDVYAFSLFKDWDGDIMQNAGALASLYGYEPSGFAMSKVDGSDVQSILDEDGIYLRALKFLYQANQMGLVDPESTTQNFDTLQTKYDDGAVLYSLWPWLGTSRYNTTENAANGKGFQSAVIDDMQCLSYGSMPLGKMEVGIMVGSKAEDPQRLVDFIDWLYSPEGIQTSTAQTGGTCGPEGLTWEMKDGKPVLTEFGVKAFVDIEDGLNVPEEWGGGSWKDGVSQLNIKTVGIVDVDEETGMCYNYQRWDDYQSRISTKLTEDWAAHHDGVKSSIEYLSDNNLLLVLAGTNYATPEYDTDISTIKEQCKQSIVAYSWQMVFAKDDAEFNSLYKEMKETVNGLGFEQVLAVDKQNCQDKIVKIKEAVEVSK
ncbi:extracellular solute-binding protein [Anaerosporobacter sp.]